MSAAPGHQQGIVTAARLDTSAPHHGFDPPTSVGGVSPYLNAAMNVSAPVLNTIRNPLESISVNAHQGQHHKLQKKCSFASNLSVHTTWPAIVYDRRAEPATCNRLTPQLAQSIKEELNAFKVRLFHLIFLSKDSNWCSQRWKRCQFIPLARSTLISCEFSLAFTRRLTQTNCIFSV